MPGCSSTNQCLQILTTDKISTVKIRLVAFQARVITCRMFCVKFGNHIVPLVEKANLWGIDAKCCAWIKFRHNFLPLVLRKAYLCGITCRMLCVKFGHHILPLVEKSQSMRNWCKMSPVKFRHNTLTQVLRKANLWGITCRMLCVKLGHHIVPLVEKSESMMGNWCKMLCVPRSIWRHKIVENWKMAFRNILSPLSDPMRCR